LPVWNWPAPIRSRLRGGASVPRAGIIEVPLDSTLDEGAAQAFNGVEKRFV
jgi:hypothetical protein